jgi:hypothetical protein
MPQVPCGQMILLEKALRKHILKYDLNKREGPFGKGECAQDLLKEKVGAWDLCLW